MPQGFNPYWRTVGSKRIRRTVAPAQELRWALHAAVTNDPLPTDPDILRVLIPALQGRIQGMDRAKGKRDYGLPSPLPGDSGSLRPLVMGLLGRIDPLDRTIKKQLARRIRLYIQVMAQRDCWPDEIGLNWRRLKLGHYEELFHDELTEIREGKLVAFGCLPAVLRLQRDHLYEYMTRRVQEVGGVLHGDGYMTRKDSPLTWLTRNQNRIYEELSFYHCACTYCSALDLDVGGLKGPGELIPSILAGLHANLTPRSLRQTLKNSARKSKVPSFLR
jgi:hypothetical protein